MTDYKKIEAVTRTETGKGFTRSICKEKELVVAILYGKGKDNVNLYVPKKEINLFVEAFGVKKEPFTISIDGKDVKVYMQDCQLHPDKGYVRHVDFMRA